jgi:hypothetical protein
MHTCPDTFRVFMLPACEPLIVMATPVQNSANKMRSSIKYQVLTTMNIKYNLKVYDDGALVQILRFWTLSIVLSLFKMSISFSFKTQRFGNWTTI